MKPTQPTHIIRHLRLSARKSTSSGTRVPPTPGRESVATRSSVRTADYVSFTSSSEDSSSSSDSDLSQVSSPSIGSPNNTPPTPSRESSTPLPLSSSKFDNSTWEGFTIGFLGVDPPDLPVSGIITILQSLFSLFNSPPF